MVQTPLLSPTREALPAGGSPSPKDRDTIDPVHEFRQCERIVQLCDTVFAGTHPRIKIPSQLADKFALVAAAVARTAPSSPVAEQQRRRQQQQQQRRAENLQSFGSNTAACPALVRSESRTGASDPAEQRHSATQDPGPDPGPGPVPSPAGKSAGLGRAEIQLQRQRLEKRLREQINQRRAETKTSAQAEALCDLDIAHVLSRAQHLASNLAGGPSAGSRPADDALGRADPVVQSDSFDENSFYSSHHDTPFSNSPAAGSEPDTAGTNSQPAVGARPLNDSAGPGNHHASPGTHPAADAAPPDAPSIANPEIMPGLVVPPSNLAAAPSAPAAAPDSRLYTTADPKRTEPTYGRITRANSGCLDRPPSAIANDNRPSVCHAVNMALEHGASPRAGPPARQRPEPGTYRPAPPHSSLPRAHVAHAYTPQSSHMPPPSVVGYPAPPAANPASTPAFLPVPSALSFLRAEQGGGGGGSGGGGGTASSPDSSPKAGLVGHPSERKKAKKKNKRKAERQVPDLEQQPPYIKPEPRSLSPAHPLSDSRPNKRQRHSDHNRQARHQQPAGDLYNHHQHAGRPDREDRAYVSYQPQGRYDRHGATSAAAAAGLEPARYSGEYVDRRRYSAELAEYPPRHHHVQPPSPYPAHHPPPPPPHSGVGGGAMYPPRPEQQQQQQHIGMDQPRPEPPQSYYYREQYDRDRIVMRPELRSQTPINIRSGASPSMAPLGAPPGRLVYDTFGREYLEPVPPPPLPVDTGRRSIGALVRHEEAGTYERGGPPYPTSRPAGPADPYDGRASYQERGSSPIYPHRPIGQPPPDPAAVAGYRPYDHPDYPPRPPPPRDEYFSVRGLEGRPMGADHHHHHYGRSASVRPSESARYEDSAEYGRMASPPRSGYAVREYVPNPYPEPIRASVQPHGREYGGPHLGEHPAGRREYSVRPMEHPQQQQQYYDGTARERSAAPYGGEPRDFAPDAGYEARTGREAYH